ncbi:MAG: peroxiredoxin, partial [Planctomycetes bacterium]|nr:peroxiredoxin [Planctomycetota bacterium]
MAVLVGRAAPDFTAQAVMPDGSFQELKLSSYKGKNVILFFYPLDFTFVCPSEIIAFHNACSEFKERNCELIGVSIDSHFSHHAWRNTPVDKGGIGKIDFPLVADLTKSIGRDYDVLVPDGSVAFRGLFLIDKNGMVRHQVVNDLPLGRNVHE